MRFEVLATVKMSMLVFWVVTPWRNILTHFSPEDGNSMFL
jgi:hypothetical protein